jgi:hypothetical protein
VYWPWRGKATICAQIADDGVNASGDGEVEAGARVLLNVTSKR